MRSHQHPYSAPRQNATILPERAHSLPLRARPRTPHPRRMRASSDPGTAPSFRAGCRLYLPRFRCPLQWRRQWKTGRRKRQRWGWWMCWYVVERRKCRGILQMMAGGARIVFGRSLLGQPIAMSGGYARRRRQRSSQERRGVRDEIGCKEDEQCV